MNRLSLGDRSFTVFIYAALALLSFSCFYPFWNALVISLNSGADTSMGGVTFWPRAFTWENYRIIFKNDNLLGAFGISVARTVLGTLTSIFATSLLAYGMTVPGLIGRKYYMIFFVVTMYFGGGLIPTFILINNLHLMDKFLVYIIPSMINVWNMIIFRTFFKGLPDGLQEAAKIDGCGPWQTYFRIVLPLSGPVLATLSLFTAIYHWNEWFYATIYIQTDALRPIQSLLRQILYSNIVSQNISNLDSGSAAAMARMQQVTSKSLSNAIMMVATIPIILVYPFLQRFFAKGVLVGSLKE